jgi:hyaluronan synthase
VPLPQAAAAAPTKATNHADTPSPWRRRFVRIVQASVVLYLIAIIAAVVTYKVAFVEAVVSDPFFTIYGLIVCTYIVSRFLLSLFYRPTDNRGVQPHVAVVMPAFNEQDAIARSIRSILALDYPADKLDVVVVNDGSTDGTLSAIMSVARESSRVRIIDFPQNQGKRAAMAAGIRATEAEIIAFVDSDSVLDADAMQVLVQDFADPAVGAVCGHADVLNVRESWLTRMQAVRYFVAFKVVKAAESVFSAVTCCSGCFSAYRRSAIMPRLDWWENQRFLGIPSTFGDDRSLTNCVLRDWKVKYQSKAVAHTIVPAGFKQFMKQQTRWKRSWTRESLIVSTFIWRKHPAAALATYVGMILPLLAPIVALRATLWQPVVGGGTAPFIYLVGIYAMALVYSLYYAVRRQSYDTLWVFGILFVFFYLAFMLWQTYYAIVTARTSKWGTRPAGIAEGGA